MAQEYNLAEEESIEKRVIPKGNIINDNDSGIDYLGHSVYAEALAEKIDHVSLPITIGIFARWGSGKSFLLKHVRNLLERKQKQDSIKEDSEYGKKKHTHAECYCRSFILFIFICIIITASMWAAYPVMFVLATPTLAENNVSSQRGGPITVSDVNESIALGNLSSTTPNKRLYPSTIIISNTVKPAEFAPSSVFWVDFSRYFALSVLLFCLVFVFIVVCGNNDWWSSQFFSNLCLLSFVAFTKLPIKRLESSIIKESSDDDVRLKRHIEQQQQGKSKTNRRYIFVNFNAWEYAGSDTLWAGIVTNLSNAVEAEFGSVAPRMFRMLHVDTITCDVISDDINATKTTIFIKFPNKQEDDDVFTALMDFGVVRFCKRLIDWKSSKLKDEKNVDTSSYSKWWVVDYLTCSDAQSAYKALYLNGLDVSFVNPRSLQAQDKLADSPELSNLSTKRTWHSASSKDDIELKPLTSKREDASSASASLNYSSPHHCYQYGPQSFLKHFMKHPKTTCNFPNLFWCILMVLVVISLPVITYVIADSFKLDIFRTGRAVPVVVQIVSWMPAIGAASFVMIKFAWAMFHSQRSRIHSALEGTKGNMAAQLGFMNKVKTEVQYITQLIHCAEFSHNRQYKVIISIDDLDRVALDKIKSVLEAVSILLSDSSSPFVCLVAVDSRVAVKCIEETMGTALLKSGVNGHEYLKKIINLPFCLPEIDDAKKKQYIEGLMDLADKTSKKRVHERRNNHSSGTRPATPTGEFTDNHSPLNSSEDQIATRSGDINNLASRKENSAPFDGDKEQHGVFAVEDSQTGLETHGGHRGHVRRRHMQGPPKLLSRPVTFDRRETTLEITKNDEVEIRDRIDGAFMTCSQPYENTTSDTVIVQNHSSSTIRTSLEMRKSTPGQKRKHPSSKADRSTVLHTIDEAQGDYSQTSMVNEEDSSNAENSSQAVTELRDEEELTNDDFLFECRKFLYKSDMVQRHLEGNPRNIKRIFNVISLTAWIMRCYKEQQRRATFFRNNAKLPQTPSHNNYTTSDDSPSTCDQSPAVDREGHPGCGQETRVVNGRITKHLAHDLVLWVILTDQWPYRMSYLLQVIEDSDHQTKAGNTAVHLHDEMSLFEIYKEFVLPKLDLLKPSDDDSLANCLDVHPDLLYSFLGELDLSFHAMNKKKAKLLSQITINLDQSLQQTILCHRDIADDIIRKKPNTETPNVVVQKQEKTTKKPKEPDCTCDLEPTKGLYKCDLKRRPSDLNSIIC